MNPSLSDNNDNMDDVLGKDALSYRNPWLVMVYFTVIPALLVIGSVFTCKFFQRDDSSENQVISIIKRDDSGFALESNAVKRFAQKISNAPKQLTLTVKAKDSLSGIFKKLDIAEESAKSILSYNGAQALRNLEEGKKLNISFGLSKGELQKIAYEINDLDTLIITAKDNGWQVETKHIDPIKKVKYLSSTINGSIYVSAREAGISPKIIMQFAKVFKHQVDPNRVRKGDEFALLYNEYTANGKKVKDGNIVAAELIHRGKKYHVIAYNLPDGAIRFYTPEGRSVEQTIDRYPVKYRRVSSRFSRSRRHPILNIRRPHLGVDFSARYGTPVKATSDGRISFAGRKGGYGKALVLKYGKYSSLYGHLSKFAKNIRAGKYVKRGQIIGYVGNTGLSTSSHLHYELRVNGRHHDPLRVKLPTGGMIASKHRGDFLAISKKMISKLDSYREEKILVMNSK